MSDTQDTPGEGERIAKAIARAGLCSRREAEALILAGRVAVNGQVITSPALDVTTRDRIVVDGEPLPQRERTRLFLYHKPRGLVTTSADPEGRPTIFEKLSKNLPRLISVGRLDINSEGLLLLTNDGGLARTLELPQTAWLRRYRVRAHGTVTQGQLAGLRNGITVDGIHYGSIEATLDRPQGSNVWITFAMREGKNREVRNVLRALGLQVNRLIRVSYGPFQLGELPEGAVEEVPTRHLREQIGERIAATAGAEFSGPIEPLKPESEDRPARPPRPRGEADSRAQRSEGDRGRRVASGAAGKRRDDPHPGRFAHSRRDGSGSSRSPAAEGRLRPSRKGEGQDKDKPARKRRGSSHHVWRDEGKPVRSKFRGARAERREAHIGGDKGEASVFSDRKGRKVRVVRFGSPKAEERAPKRSRNEPKNPRSEARKRRGFDRRSGPRPSRPRER
jgi:23S rRNA pseudouridine2605 synthase